MTSLPSLTFGQVPPISIEEFNRDARSQLSARHFKVLQAVDIQHMDATKGGLKNVISLLNDVQHDLTEIRDAKTQKRQPKLERMPNTVMTGNPLVREEQIMQWQWEELDTIEAGKTFTFTEVVVYKLKLQIISRLHSFNQEKGAKVLASVVNPSKNKEGK
jgi:hypothetical protein